MNVSDFEALPSAEQKVIESELNPAAKRDLRARVRMMRIAKAWAKSEANLKNPGYPKHKHQRCAEKIVEYKASLKNLAEHGVEVPSTGVPIGTQVDVPLGKLGMGGGKPQVST